MASVRRPQVTIARARRGTWRVHAVNGAGSWVGTPRGTCWRTVPTATHQPVPSHAAQLLDPAGGGGAKEGTGFDVAKTGDARVALIGFPSVGKSTLLSTLTGTESTAAAYEFTTLTCIPGNIMHRGTKIQLLDLPGIIEGAAHGRTCPPACAHALLFLCARGADGAPARHPVLFVVQAAAAVK